MFIILTQQHRIMWPPPPQRTVVFKVSDKPVGHLQHTLSKEWVHILTPRDHKHRLPTKAGALHFCDCLPLLNDALLLAR